MSQCSFCWSLQCHVLFLSHIVTVKAFKLLCLLFSWFLVNSSIVGSCVHCVHCHNLFFWTKREVTIDFDSKSCFNCPQLVVQWFCRLLFSQWCLLPCFVVFQQTHLLWFVQNLIFNSKHFVWWQFWWHCQNSQILTNALPNLSACKFWLISVAD